MKRAVGQTIAILLLAAGLAPSMPAQTGEIEPEAMQALNNMGAYLRTLKAFQVQADVTSEVVLEDGQKLQFAHRANVLARMPDRLMAEIDGDRKTRLMLYDGKSFTFYAQRMGYYATVPAPSTVVALAEVADEKYDIEIPLVDLFLWGGPRASASEITAAADHGPGVAAGVTCEHYAFRQPGIDWQIWIQKGDSPLPRKLVITTTTDEARPQHVSVFTWNLAPSFNEATFSFNPPPEAKKIVFAEKN